VWGDLAGRNERAAVGTIACAHLDVYAGHIVAARRCC